MKNIKQFFSIFSLILLVVFMAGNVFASPMATYITWLDDSVVVTDDIMFASDDEQVTFYWNSYAYKDAIHTTVELFDSNGILIKSFYDNSHTENVGDYHTITANTLTNGNYLLAINAEDNYDNKDSDTIWLIVQNTISPTNTAPVWTTNLLDATRYLSELTYNVTDLNNYVTDAEGDVLTFTAYSSDNGVASCNIISGDNLVCDLNSVGNTIVTVSVTDGEFIVNADFGLTVKDKLNLIELSCNDEVVLGHEVQCRAYVVDGINNPVQNSLVKFNFENDANGINNSCYTNNKGYCNVLQLIDEDYTQGNDYDVNAQAFISGIEDSQIVTDTFHLWKEGYHITEFGLYNDPNFSIEDDDFFRGEAMYTKFKITDLENNTVTDSSLIKHVYLVVNNAETLDFSNWNDSAVIVEELATSNGNLNIIEKLFTNKNDYYYYFLPKIPLTDDVLGNGNVFYFVFDIQNELAGQELIAVRINNNPIVFSGIEEITLNKNLDGSVEEYTIDLKNYVYDLETSDNEIQFSFESDYFDVNSLGNNVFKISANTANLGTYNLVVRANDTDGSIEEQTITIRIVQEITYGANAVITASEDSPYEVGQTVRFDGYESTGADGEYVSIEKCSWKITSFSGDVEIANENSEIKSPPLHCDINYKFEEEGQFKIELYVKDRFNYSDTDEMIVLVKDNQIQLNPVAIIDAPLNAYLNQNVVFNGSKSYAQENNTIISYVWKITDYDGNVLVDDFYGTSVFEYKFTRLDSYIAKLTVIDNNGLEGTATRLVKIYKNTSEDNDDYSSEPEKGIKIIDFTIIGFDEDKVEIGGDFELEAVIQNFAGENLDNVRMSFYLPEYGIEFTSSAVSLKDGQKKAVTINGFLPYDIKPGIYYPLIGVSDDHIRRIKIGYLEVVGK